MASQHIEDALELLRAEFLDQPDLCLTSVDVERLLALDLDTAEALLQALENSPFLTHSPGERFVLAPHRDRGVATHHR